MSIPSTPSPLASILAAKTYNAAWFSGSTNEAKLSSAIAKAKADGALYVFTPSSFSGLNPALVTYDAAIQVYSEDDLAKAGIISAGAYSSTVLANAFAGATNEAKITAAIAFAVAHGMKYVLVPQSMLPYNASLVTFNSAIQMLRESGYPRYIDLVAYGADGSGSGTLCDASFAAALARLTYLFSHNLGASMPSSGGVIYVAEGTYYVSQTIDLTQGINLITGLVGDGPRLTRIITSVTTTAGINACSFGTAFTVLRGFTLFQSALAIPGVQRAGNYGIRNTQGVGFQMLIDEVEVDYFGNSAIFIEGPTGPTVLSNCSLQFNAGWGLEVVPFGGNGGENIQMLAGSIHNCFGGIKVSQANGNQFHAVDIELGSTGLWPCIYLTNAAYGNSFYECTMSAQPLQALVSPSNGIVVIDNGIANTFINGINTAGNNQGTDNYRLVGSTDRTTIIGGQHTNSTVTGGFFAVIQATNTIIQNPLVQASTYQAGKNTVSEGSGAGNFTTIIGDGTNGPIGCAGITLGSSSIRMGRRMQSGRNGLTWAASILVDASLGNCFTVAATSNIAATVAAPTNTPTSGVAQTMVIKVLNSSGGALTTPVAFATTAGGFLSSAGVSPANGQAITVTFMWDEPELKWREQSRSVSL